MSRRSVLPRIGLLCILIGASSAHAQDEQAELDALLEVLDDETDIATKTRMNSDFVPGILTVLDGEQLAALGARTVWEALPFVPGVQAELDPRGSATLTARGIPFNSNSGSVQILLNSVPIAREESGANGSALYIPISQVERIEFIRGPGSVLYGDAAFQGLINIITRKGRQLSIDVDDHGGRAGGAMWNQQFGDWTLASNLSAFASDSAIQPIGRRAKEKRSSAILSAEHSGLSLLGQGLTRRLSDIRGGPSDSGFDESTWTLAARYHWPLAEQLDARLHVQYLHTDVADGVTEFDGEQVRGGAQLTWTGWSQQTWLASVERINGNTDNALFNQRRRPPPPPPGAPPQPPQPPQPGMRIRVVDQLRVVNSLILQDQIEIAPRLQLTVGARYDDNSAIGQRITPRVSLVWQPAEQHVLKAQITEGYRAPTFFELFSFDASPNDLDFELNTTKELTYIYRRPGLTARATLFDTRIDNMVFRNAQTQRFGNFGAARSEGVELEWNQQLNSHLELDANFSLANSRDSRNAQLTIQPLTLTPDFMSNVGLLWRANSKLSAGLHWNHIGAREGALVGDGDYDVLDLSLTAKDAFGEGFDLRAGVDNVLNKQFERLNPSPDSIVSMPYRDRVLWLQVIWRAP